jgi:DNA replication protein DnaC
LGICCSSYSDFLVRLLHGEWLNQQERKLQARIQRANFPEIWTLESFPFKNQPGVSRRQIQELAELARRLPFFCHAR